MDLIDPNTPIWKLTVGDLLEILKPTEQKKEVEKKFDYGIAGIARTFGCSRSTACRIKDSGKFKEAIVQTGRKIVIDVNKALSIKSEK